LPPAERLASVAARSTGSSTTSGGDAGDVIPGTGGAREIRFAGRGKGKSGGYRVITFYSGDEVPVFLLTVFAKGERADLSKAERKVLAQLTKVLVDSYRAGAGKPG
jgi:hypothetical protein